MARNTKKIILVAVAVVLFFVFVSLYASSKATLNQSEADKIKNDWSTDAQDAINRNFPGLPLSRVLAMIGTESRGDPNATGTSGERGLMQLTQPAWNTISGGTSFDQAFDGRVNIFAGVSYLKYLFDRYGDIDTATGYYNARTLPFRTAYLNRVKANEQFFE